jgi:hypothetical protein
MARRDQIKPPAAGDKRSKRTKLLTYPVGVLIRDKSNKIHYLSLAQLDEFRRPDLEVQEVFVQLDAGAAILGLKNAWLMEGFGLKSGD